MESDGVVILKGNEVASLLTDCEEKLVDLAGKAYEAHASGKSSLPHSIFLYFPDQPSNRIIALPAYLGDGFEVAGIKWVSSFPGNTAKGLDRASAVMILNSTLTGRPEAIIEGSIISAKRTAASAALAASAFRKGKKTETAGLIGCGLINFEVIRFLLAALPDLRKLTLFDLNQDQVNLFKNKCERAFDGLDVSIGETTAAVFESASLISLATTAATPHISDLGACQAGSAILHVSLRDLSPEVILSCDNIVDDVDHVCRAQTSIHLAEQLSGDRSFIRATLADILAGRAPAKKNPDSITVFSPFGLGILDLAVARWVYELAREQGRGTELHSFLPDPWR